MWLIEYGCVIVANVGPLLLRLAEAAALHEQGGVSVRAVRLVFCLWCRLCLLLRLRGPCLGRSRCRTVVSSGGRRLS